MWVDDATSGCVTDTFGSSGRFDRPRTGIDRCRRGHLDRTRCGFLDRTRHRLERCRIAGSALDSVRPAGELDGARRTRLGGNTRDRHPPPWPRGRGLGRLRGRGLGRIRDRVRLCSRSIAGDSNDRPTAPIRTANQQPFCQCHPNIGVMNRRGLLRGTAVAGAVAIAGCLERLGFEEQSAM